ncbi:MAG: glycoside hydrolase family 32 protein [Hespellia sp.]|nr:glycoside hydrolase family 32 protein [Hespellia sp.]
MEDNWRLGLHLMPPEGWLNDPNGLCWYEGEYHVFFQYSPDDVNGGLKHWGHYKSKELLNWEFTGIPLRAEEPYEKDGAYSGSAFVEDGVMHLFYTGNVKEEGDYDYITAGRGANEIHAIYTPEGEVISKECVLTNADYPEYYTCHVRDPKIWKEKDTYYMVLGGRDRDDIGKVLVYASSNLKDWTFLQDICSKEPFGYMWECPDYFEVGGVKLLSISPQGIETAGHDYENVYQSGFYKLSGSIIGRYALQEFTEWDHGFDFYAPQTFSDDKGRRILVGWMGIPDADYTNPTTRRGWQHGLTIPRVLTEKGGVIYQKPVEELKELRTGSVVIENQKTIFFDIAELLVQNQEDQGFTVIIADGMNICYWPKEHCVTLEFTDAALGSGRRIRHCNIESCKDMQIFLDRSAVEIYINHGEKVMTSRYYPTEDKRSVKLQGSQCVATLWNLKPMSM